jgi:uncharacterized protein (DUF2147 family)
MKSKTIRRTQVPREDLLATGRADSPVTQGSRITRLFLEVGVIVVALWSAAVVTPVTPREQEPSAAGLWEKVDASGRPEAWFRISECGGVYEGQIVKIFSKPGEDPSQWRCSKCEGGQRDAPVLGITFIKDMQRNGLSYENGTILDPRDGSVYQARMELSPDGNRLTVRGYLGISLLGQSQVWRRLPDSALEPSKTGSCAPSRPERTGG